jgi:hypothetical protein
MFNDRFNDEVRRYRLRLLLVLAVLVLFGLGAGHLATRALGVGGSTPASALFADGAAYGLQSDGGGAYVDDAIASLSQCVSSVVLAGGRGTWKLGTPYYCSNAVRSFRLVLFGGVRPDGTPLSGQLYPSSGHGSNPLNLSGSTNVWGNLATNAFTSTPDQGANAMAVYIKTAAAEPLAFVLAYKYRFQIAPYGPGSNTRTVSTPSTFGSAEAELYQFPPQNSPGPNFPVLVGTFNVPCSITITQYP